MVRRADSKRSVHATHEEAHPLTEQRRELWSRWSCGLRVRSPGHPSHHHQGISSEISAGHQRLSRTERVRSVVVGHGAGRSGSRLDRCQAPLHRPIIADARLTSGGPSPTTNNIAPGSRRRSSTDWCRGNGPVRGSASWISAPEPVRWLWGSLVAAWKPPGSTYLPLRSTVAARTEDLVLEYNPDWPKAGWHGVHPEQVEASTVEASSMSRASATTSTYRSPMRGGGAGYAPATASARH